ncbi:hypothetical protein F4780DRAFT_789637 [Xylariomycetidae sp. FL0641]|nr:hypothetical protein F4780DRAFT_789637 [Xylariomycetidae sp. FL0641]
MCLPTSLAKSLRWNHGRKPRHRQQQPEDPVDLLRKREIQSLRELQHAWNHCTFVALDCVFLPSRDAMSRPTVTEIGLACWCPAAAAAQKAQPLTAEPRSLEEFHARSGAQVDTIYIRPWHPPPAAGRGAPRRLGGKQRRLSRHNLARRLRRIVRTYADSATTNTTNPKAGLVVLVGFDLAPALAAMRTDFPAVAGLFAACADLRPLSASLRRPAGIREALRLCGYAEQEEEDNAAVAATSALALLQRMGDADAVARLRRRVRDYDDVEGAPAEGEREPPPPPGGGRSWWLLAAVRAWRRDKEGMGLGLGRKDVGGDSDSSTTM